MNGGPRRATRHPLVTKLRTERVRVGASQTRLAGVVGAHPDTIWRGEVGRFDPRLTTFVAWAGALGFDVVLVRKGRARDAAWRREMGEPRRKAP